METKSLLAGALVLCALANLAESGKNGKCSYKFTVPDKEGCSSADAAVSEIQSQITNLAEQNTLILKENANWREAVENGLKNTAESGSNDKGSSGAVYIRWGRTTCPDQAEQLYKGFAAGSHYSHVGGSSELLCLPKSPEWGTYKDDFQGRSFVYGSEYETGYAYTNNGVFKADNIDGDLLHNSEVPCALCYTPGRTVAYKFPATLTCPNGWNEEYHGFLMSGHHTHQTKVQAVCMDEAPEMVEGTKQNLDGALVYNMEARCGSLPCPEYVQGRELTCVICSR